jgi:uncharacterized protein YndB with AHSA1/START domain
VATQHQPTVTLELRRIFAAPRERVFRAWTAPEELKRWHAPGPLSTPLAEVDLRVGGTYRIHMRAPDGNEHRVTGVYREVDPPSKLVFTWHWETDPPGGDDTLVTVEFQDRGPATEVLLRHEQFRTSDARANHEDGWTACFVKLAAILELHP